MKKRTDLERLLSDVLAEDELALTRPDLLSQTLDHVRRKRQRRLAARGALGAVLLSAITLSLWRSHPPDRPEIVGVRIVATTPLPPDATFESRSGSTPVLVSSASSLAFVETRAPDRDWQAIDDDQLLTLVDRPAALVRYDTQHAELVFSNPSDLDRIDGQ